MYGVDGNDDSSFPLEVAKDFVGKEYVSVEKIQCSCIRDNTPWMSTGLKQCLDSL